MKKMMKIRMLCQKIIHLIVHKLSRKIRGRGKLGVRGVGARARSKIWGAPSEEISRNHYFRRKN